MGETKGINFKKSASKKAASELCFTQRQADAILDMRLYKLIGMEILALQKEYDETLKKIENYEDILNNYDSMAKVIIKDLDEIKKEYGRERRTVICNAETVEMEEEAEVDMEVVLLADRFGYVRTMDPAVYERNKDAANAESRFIIRCMTSDKLCVFTDRGNMHTVKVSQVPYGKFRDKGTPVDNISGYSSADEYILYMASMAQLKERKLVFASKSGFVKIVDGSEFDVSRRTVAATKLNSEDDSLVLVGDAGLYDYLVLQSQGGFFLRFPLKDIPEKKKAAIGTHGMKLAEGEVIEAAYLVESRIELDIEYKGKNISLNKLKLGSRGGKGVKIRV